MDERAILLTAVGIGRKVGHGNRGGGGIKENVEIAEDLLEAGDGRSGQNGHGEQCD